MNSASDFTWLAAEDAAARAEREAGWHRAWGPGTPAPGAAHRPFIWDFHLAHDLAQARLTLAAQKGLPGVWLDGRLLYAAQDLMSGRELQDLDLGTLGVGPHRIAVLVRSLHPFIQAPRQGGVAALLRGVRDDGTARFIAPQPADWLTRANAQAQWHVTATDATWQPAQSPAEAIDWQPTPPQPARLLRRGFNLPEAPIATATLTITALGGCEAELNGLRVGDAQLAPENSDFRDRRLVGWTLSRAVAGNDLCMVNSGIAPAERRQGIYSRLVELTIEHASARGYRSITSRHVPMNNGVIIAKLRLGFQVSGFEYSEVYGPWVCLRYLVSAARQQLCRVRAIPILPLAVSADGS